MTSPSPSPAPTPTPSPSLPPFHPNHPIGHANSTGKRWPTDYYTVDVGTCIRESNARTHRLLHRQRHQNLVFSEFFPNVRFVPSTFSQQRGLWNKASSSLKEEFMNLGHCREGLWSAFARRARKEKAVVQLGDTIEID
jgi:hypothetical protein